METDGTEYALRHPSLRGRPVAVNQGMLETSCGIAASYEAKPYGAKTGTEIAESRLLCPVSGIGGSDRPPHQGEYHPRVLPRRQVSVAAGLDK